jgi:zinc finger CCHC domain-containing protein 9
VCKSTAHRAKDCPEEAARMEKEGFDSREERRRRGDMVLGMGDGAGADEDDFMVQSREDISVGKKKGSKGKMEKKPPANNGIRGPTKDATASNAVALGQKRDVEDATPGMPTEKSKAKAMARIVKF